MELIHWKYETSKYFIYSTIIKYHHNTINVSFHYITIVVYHQSNSIVNTRNYRWYMCGQPFAKSQCVHICYQNTLLSIPESIVKRTNVFILPISVPSYTLHVSTRVVTARRVGWYLQHQCRSKP